MKPGIGGGGVTSGHDHGDGRGRVAVVAAERAGSVFHDVDSFGRYPVETAHETGGRAVLGGGLGFRRARLGC